MNKQGISTAKGFFTNVPFAKELIGTKTSLPTQTVTIGSSYIDLPLEEKCTYLFEVHFSALGYYHTAILTVPETPENGMVIAESTAFIYRYVGSGGVGTAVMVLVYNTNAKTLSFATDRALEDAGKTADVTIKYTKIRDGV